jgi:hypothetical protein
MESESDNISPHALPNSTHHPPSFIDSWLPSTLSILELPSHLNVTLRPDELELISREVKTMKEVVQQNHNWAYSAYSATNHIHKLAFIVAWVMTRIAPTYMVATRTAPRNQPPPWIDTRNASRRPLQSGPICFGFWLMYLVTMLDSHSPLRQGLQPVIGGRRIVLGADWVDSMSTHTISPTSL